MPYPDYGQNAFHHSCLLVLLCGVGHSKPRSLQKSFEKVRSVNTIKVTDSNGISRNIWIRYIHDHPVENNDWGDFQTHRRLLGLITIGKFENQVELNELCRQHESLKVRYGNTLYETRAIFYGPNSSTEEKNITHIDDINDVDNSRTLQAIAENSHNIELPTRRLQDEFTTPSNFKTQAFFYRENDMCADLESRITDFVNALFWVLESRRLERSREKTEKVNLLIAPQEKRDFVGLDMESRNNKKKCIGRVMKNLADLSLQAGMVEDALNLYHNSCETLRAAGDALWVGSAEEGLCAASTILLYPHLREMENFYRNTSVQDGYPSLRSKGEKWCASDLTKKLKTFEANSNEGTQNPITLQITSASSSCSSVSSILTMNSSALGTPKSSSSTSTISAVTCNQQKNCELPSNILKAEEIPNYYRKAIINYKKYQYAAIIETEATLKAARICIEQNRPLDVAMFLQKVLYININMSEFERIKQFEIISDLYQQIGYQRKAAFFQRLAAQKHVHDGNIAPDWDKSYRLILTSFSGYLLSLDPIEVLKSASGWPSIQIDLIQNLITAARQLGHSALATRHMTFLLQTQWKNMSTIEQSEMAVQLQNLGYQCEGSPVPLVLENGTVIPPANLTDLPYCMDLQIKDLPAHLRPQDIKIVKADSGPFLFTPIHFSSIDRRGKQKDKNKISFFWVQGNLSKVSICLRNPLPFELTVKDMRLLTNGIVFESLPQTITLQPHVPTYVTLHGTPKEVGQLNVQGYSTHTLGVKSNCRIKHMYNRNFPQNYLIDVIPALPYIILKTSLPQVPKLPSITVADTVVASVSLSLYNGESSACVVTIINNSMLPIEHLELSINSNLEQEIQKKIFHINEMEIQTKLPIPPQSSIDFIVDIFGEADFIYSFLSNHAATTHSSSDGSNRCVTNNEFGSSSLKHFNVISSGHASLPSRVITPQQLQNTISNRRNDVSNTSFRSAINSDYHQSLAALSLMSGGNPTSSLLNCSQYIEAQLHIKYSGGEAMNAGYCRQCAISFNLELQPSVQITGWDVLPAEIPSQFYLVLDIANLTAQEMSLNYTDNKNILIEAKESCRVPIPVDRCSLEQVYAARVTDHINNAENDNCNQLISFPDSISKLCSEHIAQKVKLNWLLSGTNIRGIASLRGIVLTTSMIDLTTISPLQWIVSFQNSFVEPHTEIICNAGQICSLSICIYNQSLQPLKNLTLTIKFYQDYLNGMENYNLETRVAVSGPNRILIPCLQKQEKTQFEYSVLFFTPGRFKTSIQCCSKSQIFHITKDSYGECSAFDAQIHSKNQIIPINEINIENTTAKLYHEQQEHIWKFIPPIEVTVVE